MLVDDSIEFTEEQIINSKDLTDSEKIKMLKSLKLTKKANLTDEEMEDSKNILLG